MRWDAGLEEHVGGDGYHPINDLLLMEIQQQGHEIDVSSYMEPRMCDKESILAESHTYHSI